MKATQNEKHFEAFNEFKAVVVVVVTGRDIASRRVTNNEWEEAIISD